MHWHEQESVKYSQQEDEDNSENYGCPRRSNSADVEHQELCGRITMTHVLWKSTTLRLEPKRTLQRHQANNRVSNVQQSRIGDRFEKEVDQILWLEATQECMAGQEGRRCSQPLFR